MKTTIKIHPSPVQMNKIDQHMSAKITVYNVVCGALQNNSALDEAINQVSWAFSEKYNTETGEKAAKAALDAITKTTAKTPDGRPFVRYMKKTDKTRTLDFATFEIREDCVYVPRIGELSIAKRDAKPLSQLGCTWLHIIRSYEKDPKVPTYYLTFYFPDPENTLADCQG